MAVEETKHCGLSWGRKCSVCCLVLSFLYLLLSLAYSLTMRLYLKAYYNSAHVAGLSVVVALFVISHHLCQVRRSLGCCIRLFAITQTCLNLAYFICSIVLTAGYVIISVLAIHINFDYTVAAGLAGINVIWLFYLIITSCGATKGDRYMDYEVDVQFVWHSDSLGGIANDMELFGYPAYGDMNTTSTIKSTDKGSLGTNASLVSKKSQLDSKRQQSRQSCEKCVSCCRVLWNFCFGVVYFFVQVILIVIFALSACHPVFIAADTYQYRNAPDLYSVSVPGHRPLALYLKCRGSGNETIVYENGLGSMAMMAWDFIPRILEDKYTVCITDRRGYGWSETYEFDDISLLADSQHTQWSQTNSQLFAELIKQARIKTPFYYIGHSYGGHHLVQVAINHPELVKSLIFLDSAHFNPVDTFEDYLEIVNNFNAMGVMYILTQTNWYDFTEAFSDVVDFDGLSEEGEEQLLVSFRTGYYFEAYFREHKELATSNGEPAYEGIRKALDNNNNPRQITTPTFIIDAGWRDPAWFPKEYFTNYNESIHYSWVPGASHSLLTLSDKYGSVTSDLIDQFIQYDLGLITEGELRNRTRRVGECEGRVEQSGMVGDDRSGVTC